MKKAIWKKINQTGNPRAIEANSCMTNGANPIKLTNKRMGKLKIKIWSKELKIYSKIGEDTALIVSLSKNNLLSKEN